MAKSSDGWQHFGGRMLPSSIRCAAHCMLVSSLGWCVGCGATGLAWVGEGSSQAHSGSDHVQVIAGNVSASPEAVSLAIPAAAEQNSIEPRPRLNHTVTLGEIDVVVSERTGAAPASAPSTSVSVYNYNQVNVVTPAYGYGSFGYSRFSPGRVTPAPVRPSAPGPLPGQSWPAVADHGPSFPYSSAPASPWTRTQ